MSEKACGAVKWLGLAACDLPEGHGGRHSDSMGFGRPVRWGRWATEAQPKAQRNRNATNETGAPADAETPRNPL